MSDDRICELCNGTRIVDGSCLSQLRRRIRSPARRAAEAACRSSATKAVATARAEK